MTDLALVDGDAPKEFHEYADYFPMMDDDEFAELVDDVRENGLLEPIVLFEGKILDGRNRYRACIESDVEPCYTTYSGDSPVSYIVSKNIHRRHLNKTQQATILIDLKPAIQEEIRQQDEAAGIKRTEKGGTAEAPREKSGRFTPRPRDGGRGEWTERLAQKGSVGKTTLTRVDRVAREAPDLMPKLRSGEQIRWTVGERRSPVHERCADAEGEVSP